MAAPGASAEAQVNELLDAMPADQAALMLMRYLFPMIAQIRTDLDLQTKILGVIAGGLGLADQVISAIEQGPPERKP